MIEQGFKTIEEEIKKKFESGNPERIKQYLQSFESKKHYKEIVKDK
jgi:hypothetical protein